MAGGQRLKQTVLGNRGKDEEAPHRRGGRKRATQLHGPTASDGERTKRTKDDKKLTTAPTKTPSRRSRKAKEFSFQMGPKLMETPKLPKKGDTESDSDMRMEMTEESDNLSNMSASSSESMETIGSVSIQADGSTKRISKARHPRQLTRTGAPIRKASDLLAEAYAVFNPRDLAYWQPDENVPYKFLADTFDLIEATTKRLEITRHLTECYRCILEMTPSDLLPAIYLCINKVGPAHEGLELGVGDSILYKAIANVSGGDNARIRKQYDKDGDLGLVAMSRKKGQVRLMAFDKLSISGVFKKFLAIAKDGGEKSQERKRDRIESLLNASRDSEIKFITRSLQGKLRIGLAEQTVLQSVGQAFFMHQTPSKDQDTLMQRMEEAVDRVKQAYSTCPSYDKLIPCLLDHGLNGLEEHLSFTPGIPVQPMLAKPTTGISEVLEKFSDTSFTCEFKYDGERSQIHVLPNKTVLIYTRNSENVTGKYPDIVQQIPAHLKPEVQSVVLDCETVAFDTQLQKIMPFQKLSTRARKDVTLESIKVPVCVFCFDCLYLNGESLLGRPLTERRASLYNAVNSEPGVIQFAEHQISTNVEELQHFLDLAVDGSTEGLIVKTLDCSYEPSKRSVNWLKLKKDYLDGVGDSFDLVVIGAWHGKGKRTGVFGSFLLAVYDPINQEYQSITKIGTGFSEEDLETHTRNLRALELSEPASNYSYGEAAVPDVWFEAKMVWEVKAADLSISPVHQAALGILDETKGISIRFPRLIRVRDDKSATDATTSDQVVEMYNKQTKVPELSEVS